MTVAISIAHLNLWLGVILALASVWTAVRTRDAGWWLMAAGFLAAASVDLLMFAMRGRGGTNIAPSQVLTPILAATLVPGLVLHSRSRVICWGFWCASAALILGWRTLHLVGLESWSRMGAFTKPWWCITAFAAGAAVTLERSLVQVRLRRDGVIWISAGIALLALSSLFPYMLLHNVDTQLSIHLWSVRNAVSAAASAIILIGFLQAKK